MKHLYRFTKLLIGPLMVPFCLETFEIYCLSDFGWDKVSYARLMTTFVYFTDTCWVPRKMF